jgi:signal transduction histidine kinase
MNIRFLFAFLSLAVLLPGSVHAQNNPYDIDDECYEYFQQAELLVGKEGFQQANDALLQSAVRNEDSKAQTLYYVEKLKHLSNRYTSLRKENTDKTIPPEEEADILKAMEDVKSISRKLGYVQYYYYAYQIVENYYYNNGSFFKVMDLVQEMQETARENDEDYGLWMGDRYLVDLYVTQNDYISAKKYIIRALETYNNTKDPTILRQSTTRLYCDLTDTYPIGHDSVLVNLEKAEKAAKQHIDSLRCTYYRAKLSAYQKDTKAYEKARDICLADPHISRISTTANQLFSNLDNIIYTPVTGTPDIDLTGMTLRIREVKYIANVAESYGFKELAFELEKRLVAHNERMIASSNSSKLTELDARLGNTKLSARIDEQSKRMLQISRLVIILLAVIMLLALIFSWIYIANLKKTSLKVQLADAAKTRFIQNMSHEVRTPLNAIVGFSQLLSLPDGSFPEEDKQEFSEHIVNNTKMLTMLLDDILNTAAMDGGNYRIVYEEAELHHICQEALSSTEHRLQPGVNMYYAPEDPAPFHFTTDPRRVQQILINLLTNSCKHTSQGEIKLVSSVKENAGYVTFTVTDTGTGIPAQEAERIFERFTKLNDFVQGSGLGLSICRDIANRLDAKVYLDTSYSGDGARFKFLVPLATPKETSIVQA